VRERFAGEPQGRFDKCLATLLQKQRIHRQKPTFMYFPHLPAIEFYDRGDFPWLDSIEAATDDIRAELMAVLADGPSILEPYMTLPAGVALHQWRELNHSRKWGVYYLCARVSRSRNTWRVAAHCGSTAAWPRCDVPGCADRRVLHPRRQVADPAAFGRHQYAPCRASAVDHPARVRLPRRRRAARVAAGKALIFDDTSSTKPGTTATFRAPC